MNHVQYSKQVGVSEKTKINETAQVLASQ